MKDLFFLLLVTLPYFSFYSVSITQCYLDATYTSATILKSNSDFLSNLQLATVVNDASWRARLLHKHKGSLKKNKTKSILAVLSKRLQTRLYFSSLFFVGF
jgi:hypothetical protein